jgi:hypothetical protein
MLCYLSPYYAKELEQASIIGGAINYAKELEQLLQSLEARKHAHHGGVLGCYSPWSHDGAINIVISS